MSNTYTVYATSQAPQALIDKQPHHAKYFKGGISLFVHTLEDVTGTPNPEVISIKSQGFNHPYIEGEEGLTSEQLLGAVNHYMGLISSGVATSAELQFSKAQGHYIYEEIFKPEIENEVA